MESADHWVIAIQTVTKNAESEGNERINEGIDTPLVGTYNFH